MGFDPRTVADLIEGLGSSASHGELFPPVARAFRAACDLSWVALYLADGPETLHRLTAEGDPAALARLPASFPIAGPASMAEGRLPVLALPHHAVGFGPGPEGLLVISDPVDGGRETALGLARILTAVLHRARTLEELRREGDQREAEMSRRRHAEEAKDRFLSAVSHEFRTPLTSIRSFAEILLTHEPEDRETAREFISIIHEESVRLSRLVNDLLDLSKMQAGRMAWDFRPSDLRDAVRRATRSVASALAETHLTVEEQFEGAFAQFVFDRDKVIQVLVNLLSNAARFSPPGGVINVLATPAEDGARVSVRDRGPGIPADDRARIFERFSQLAGPRRGAAGTGLGLSISREIVLAHGGRIGVDEAPGGGSDFWFEIPAVPAAHIRSLPPEAATPPDPPVELPEARGERILVADDDVNFRRFLHFELTRAGYRVRSAANGIEAVWSAREETPDLLILDLRLPDLEGDDILALLRKRESTKGVPILVVSVAPPEQGAALVAPDRVMRKPIDGAELRRKIAAILAAAEAPAAEG